MIHTPGAPDPPTGFPAPAVAPPPPPAPYPVPFLPFILLIINIIYASQKFINFLYDNS